MHRKPFDIPKRQSPSPDQHIALKLDLPNTASFISSLLKINSGKSVGQSAELLGNIKCLECNSRMEVRPGRYSYFLGCTKYPSCNRKRPIEAEWVQVSIVSLEPRPEVLTCPNCGSPTKTVRGRRGVFLSCSAYPACRCAKGLEVMLWGLVCYPKKAMQNVMSNRGPKAVHWRHFQTREEVKQAIFT